MKRLLLIGAMTLLFVSCATSVDSTVCVETGEAVGGFWWGLWNGMTAGFAFIGSLFDDTIAIYDVNNKGGLYDLGFVLGTGSLGSIIKGIINGLTKE